MLVQQAEKNNRTKRGEDRQMLVEQADKRVKLLQLGHNTCRRLHSCVCVCVFVCASISRACARARSLSVYPHKPRPHTPRQWAPKWSERERVRERQGDSLGR